MLTKRFLLGFSIFNSCVCQAHPVNQHSEKLMGNNFTAFTNGQSYCLSAIDTHKNMKTCFPVFNTSEHVGLKFKLPDGSFMLIQQGEMAATIDTTKDSSFNTVIALNCTGKCDVVYSGAINNMEGLICNEFGCKPWK
ncbi:hypothetical protein D5018_13460 [Parashewanella curva]|uniref:Uncharacterized protein n=1 Tax=Parashewanella curva TaxID=2338552 RepID=A0A3L8PUQ0_9GAMM|nr:hypothetical protein [Parashewanella curva]RLV59145.1 hypothetical protein D5018_13460 [Parashewanella curva]